MGAEGLNFDEIAGGVSPAFVETLYARFKADPNSVEPGWRAWFDGLDAAVGGPSWGRAGWPLAETDALTAALDPTQMEPAPARPARGADAAPDAQPAAAEIGRAHV